MRGKKNMLVFPAITLLLLIPSCTKLDTKTHDKVTNFWQNDVEIAAAVGAAYADLRNYGLGFPGGIYTLNEMSTDEIIVPIRLSDWVDGFNWERMWKHTWVPEDLAMKNGWQFIYGGIAHINFIIEKLQELRPAPAALQSYNAQLKTIRAFYYFLAVDLFGQVPVFENNNVSPSQLGNKPRQEVYAYIEKELKENLNQLSPEVNTETYGRATRWFAYSILAKLYLNAEVYTGVPKWEDCMKACDAILNANKYSLEADFFSNFKVANEGSRENIFVLPFDRNAGLNLFVIQWLTLHYNSPATFGLEMFPGQNGYCSTVAYYNLFDANDKRRKMFLVGQQYEGGDSSKPQYDRLGNLLSFDPDFSSFIVQDPKIETAGARCAKWEFNKQGPGNMSNDFAIFRLADIILMKAESQFRQGNISGALATINQKINGISIRGRAGLPDFSSSEMNADGLMKERACELSWEGWRRNDMIRLGHFTDARVPEKAVSQDYRKLYPIPQAELEKNTFLVQNPGYPGR